MPHFAQLSGPIVRAAAAFVPLLISFIACTSQADDAPVQESPAASPTATAVTSEPVPTSTPEPVPTSTPEPTATPTPSPEFVPEPVILPTVDGPIIEPPRDGPLEMKLDAIGLQVSVIRELSTKRPIEREFVTRDEMAKRLKMLFDEDVEEFEKVQRLYVTLGILGKDESYYDLELALLGEGVAGFYEPREEKFYLVEDDEEFSPADESIFAHEYVHGLQQQYFDLQAIHDRLKEANNADAGAAFQALREGDAYLFQLVYVGEAMEPEEAALANEIPSEALIETFRAAPRVIQRSYIYPFQEGLQFVIELYRDDAWTAVTGAFYNLPLSTEQILHPEKYLSGEAPVEVEVPDLLDELGEGWSEVMEDTMGEFFLVSYMGTDFSTPRAAAAAEGWGGDRFKLFKGPQNEDLLVSYISWDSEEDAREFFETFVLFTQARNGLTSEPLGGLREITMATTGDRVVYAALPEAMEAVVIYAPGQPILAKIVAALGLGETAGP